MTLSRRAAGAALAVYVLVLAFIVLWPSGQIASNAIHWMTSVVDDAGAEGCSCEPIAFAANVLLLVPFSFFGSVLLGRWRWIHWLVAGLLVSSAIELAQMLFLPGRSPSAQDILANTLGVLLGYLLAAVLLRRRAVNHEEAEDSRLRSDSRD